MKQIIVPEIVYFIVAEEIPSNLCYIYSEKEWGVLDEQAAMFNTVAEAKSHRCGGLPTGKPWKRCVVTYNTVTKQMLRLD